MERAMMKVGGAVMDGKKRKVGGYGQRRDEGWFGDYYWGRKDGKDAASVIDKYANVVTLGLKHPLSIEERQELVLGLLTMLQK